MEIKDNRPPYTNVFFKDIANGACFEFKEEFYIKGSDEIENLSGATNLSDGIFTTTFEPLDQCLLVNASIIIERN